MENSCHIHPTKDAEWICPECGEAFCSDCILKRESGGYYGQSVSRCCPSCVVPVSWVGIAGSIKPFWKKMDKIFTYPLQANPLILNILIAFFSTILANMQIGLFGGTAILLGRLLLAAVMLNYAYLALHKTSQGDLVAPPMYSDRLTANVGTVFSQIIFFVLLAALGVFLFAKGGLILGSVYALVAMFCLPSMLIILAMDGNPFKAMNPAAFFALPFKIGSGYFIMWFFLALLLFAPGTLLGLINPVLPPFLAQLLGAIFGNYYLLVAYHLMGYVLLQYSDELGFSLDYDDVRQASDASIERPDDRATDLNKRVAALFTDGKYDEAIDALSNWEAQGQDFSKELSEKYFALLKVKGLKDKMLSHCPILMDHLASDNDKAKAVDAYNECLRLDSNLTPSPDSALKIAGWLAETGNIKGAIGAYNKITKAYPKHQNVPMAYFRAAQLLNDRLNNNERAKTVLQGVIKKYPDHEIIPKVKNYLEYIGG